MPIGVCQSIHWSVGVTTDFWPLWVVFAISSCPNVWVSLFMTAPALPACYFGIRPLFKTWKSASTVNLNKTSHPRIAHGQRCPMPCLEWLSEEVEREQGSGPKRPMSCRTQGWISRRPEKAHLRADLIDWSTVMRHIGADLGGPRAQMRSGMRAD